MFDQRARFSTQQGSLSILVVFMLNVTACTYKLTETDCARYRDRLKQWSATKGNTHDNKDISEGFMKSCIGLTLSKNAYRCLERAKHEEAFFQCLE